MKLKLLDAIPENGQFIAIWKNKDNDTFWAENYIVVEDGIILAHDMSEDDFYELSNAREHLESVKASFYIEDK